MEQDQIKYISVNVLGMKGNIRKELPLIEKLVGTDGRLMVTENGLLERKATLTYDCNGDIHVIVAGKEEGDILSYLRGLNQSGLIIPKKNLKGIFNVVNSIRELSSKLGYF